MADIKCPDCNGSKQIIAAFVDGYKDGKRWSGHNMPMTCFRCKGTGSVPEEMLKWIKHGKILKESRMNPYRNQREEARRRNITPSELSKMEMGYINNTHLLTHPAEGRN